MQYIRELTYGAPKTGKTANKGDTYPTPMLILNTDPGGPDSISKRKVDIISSADFRVAMSGKQENWSEVTVLDYSSRKGALGFTQFVTPNRSVMDDFIQDVNALTAFMPFKTVMLDSWTGMDAIVMDFIWALNGQSMGALSQYTLQYYGQLGKKKEEIIGVLLALPTNVVVIAHEETVKDEMVGSLQIVPAGTGKLQQTMGKYFSQVLHSNTEMGKDGKPRFIIETVSKDLVKGIGMRFPQGRPPVVDHNWKAIYE